MLKLMYSALVRASDRWRGIGISEFEKRQLEKLREPARSRSPNSKHFGDHESRINPVSRCQQEEDLTHGSL